MTQERGVGMFLSDGGEKGLSRKMFVLLCKKIKEIFCKREKYFELC